MPFAQFSRNACHRILVPSIAPSNLPLALKKHKNGCCRTINAKVDVTRTNQVKPKHIIHPLMVSHTFIIDQQGILHTSRHPHVLPLQLIWIYNSTANGKSKSKATYLHIRILSQCTVIELHVMQLKQSNWVFIHICFALAQTTFDREATSIFRQNLFRMDATSSTVGFYPQNHLKVCWE